MDVLLYKMKKCLSLSCFPCCHPAVNTWNKGTFFPFVWVESCPCMNAVMYSTCVDKVTENVLQYNPLCKSFLYFFITNYICKHTTDCRGGFFRFTFCCSMLSNSSFIGGHGHLNPAHSDTLTLHISTSFLDFLYTYCVLPSSLWMCVSRCICRLTPEIRPAMRRCYTLTEKV